MRKYRIATRLITWFLIIALAPLAIVSVLAVSNAERELRDEIESQLQTVADSKARQIHVYFRQRVKDATTLAGTSDVVGTMEKLGGSAGTPDGESSGIAVADPESHRFLLSYVETAGYENLHFVSTTGVTVYSVNEDVASNQQQRADEMRHELARVAERAATLLEPSLSDVVNPSRSGRPARYLAAPIIKDGTVLGVVALQMSHREINALVQDYTGLGRTGETVVGSRMGNEVLFVTPLRHDPKAAFHRRITMDSGSETPMHQAVRGRKGRGRATDYRAQDVVAVWRYVPSFRWGMVVKIDADEAFAPVRQLRYQSILIGGIAALVVIGIALLVSRSISRPIGQLTDSVKRIAAGALGERVAIATADEIGELATEFNHMADQLGDKIELLSQQDTRTRTILDSTADGIVTVAEDGTVRSFNAAAQQLFACRSIEVAGCALEQVSPELGEIVSTSEANGRETEFECHRRDGQTIPLALRVTRVVCRDERLIIATVQDIRQRKQIETERERLLTGIRDAVQQLSKASREILGSTTQQSGNAQQQASLVSETTTTVEEIARSAERASERAQQVAGSARHADDVSQSGREAVGAAISAMQNVRCQSERTAESILLLAERAQAIGEIVVTVREIAEQTNVLALNAAVEASRAGEQGRGFSVVAAEVKSLAQRSKAATQQIRQILAMILDATEQAVMSTEKGEQSINQGEDVVTQADETINTLAETIGAAARAASQIVASASEQAAAMSQISLSMAQVDQVSRQTLAATRQAQVLADDLNGLGSRLAELLQQGDR